MALMLSGSSVLFVEEFTLRGTAEMRRARMPSVFVQMAPASRHEISPPPWLPVTLLVAGGLTVLYSLALPRNSS